MQTETNATITQASQRRHEGRELQEHLRYCCHRFEAARARRDTEAMVLWLVGAQIAAGQLGHILDELAAIRTAQQGAGETAAA